MLLLCGAVLEGSARPTGSPVFAFSLASRVAGMVLDDSPTIGLRHGSQAQAWAMAAAQQQTAQGRDTDATRQ